MAEASPPDPPSPAPSRPWPYWLGLLVQAGVWGALLVAIALACLFGVEVQEFRYVGF